MVETVSNSQSNLLQPSRRDSLETRCKALKHSGKLLGLTSTEIQNFLKALFRSDCAEVNFLLRDVTINFTAYGHGEVSMSFRVEGKKIACSTEYKYSAIEFGLPSQVNRPDLLNTLE